MLSVRSTQLRAMLRMHDPKLNGNAHLNSDNVIGTELYMKSGDRGPIRTPAPQPIS